MYGGLNSDGTWNGMVGMVMRGVGIYRTFKTKRNCHLLNKMWCDCSKCDYPKKIRVGIYRTFKTKRIAIYKTKCGVIVQSATIHKR